MRMVNGFFGNSLRQLVSQLCYSLYSDWVLAQALFTRSNNRIPQILVVHILKYISANIYKFELSEAFFVPNCMTADASYSVLTKNHLQLTVEGTTYMHVPFGSTDKQ